MRIFQEVLFFSSYTKHKNIKTNKQLIQLILCQLDVGGWQKEKGMRLTDVSHMILVKTILQGTVSQLVF